jgi:hypothetical protein
MAIFYSPRSVTENLSLCLDAGNTKSYPGSGTTWTDLSSSGITASMFGSVPFETDVTRCFNFATATGSSSADSSLGFSLSGAITNSTGDYTFEVWVKNVNSSSGQVGLISNAGGGDGFRFGVGTNGIYALCGPDYTEGAAAYTSSFDNNKWHQVVAVFNRTGSVAGSPRVLLYLDGVYQDYLGLPASQTAQNASAPGIVRSPCCGIYTGKLSVIKAYKKALSAAEIAQNFQALRGRYEL